MYGGGNTESTEGPACRALRVRRRRLLCSPCLSGSAFPCCRSAWRISLTSDATGCPMLYASCVRTSGFGEVWSCLPMVKPGEIPSFFVESSPVDRKCVRYPSYLPVDIDREATGPLFDAGRKRVCQKASQEDRGECASRALRSIAGIKKGECEDVDYP